MIMIADNAKKIDAKEFFISKSPKFRLYITVMNAARILSWVLPLAHVLIKGLYYGISRTPIPGYAYFSTVINVAMLFGTMRLLVWGLKFFRDLEYHQYPFGKEEETLEFTPEGSLLFQYRIGKKHYMDKIRIASTEVRPEWNAVAVTGWIQQYAVKGEQLSLQKEGKGARVFFDYYSPSIIKQFDKKKENRQCQ